MAKKSGHKEYDNTNRGALFINDRKERDTQPDLTGVLDVDGVEFYVNAWKNPDGQKDHGKPVLKLSVKPKAEPARTEPKKAPNAKPVPAAPAAEFDDDLGF